MESIDFSSIGDFPRIYLDYISQYSLVEELFNGNPADASSWKSIMKALDSRKYLRSKLKQILEKQNKKFGNLKLLTKQLNKLENPQCLAVITGQQAGLFGGPLYTIYKAQTAVRLAEHLEKQYNRPVVPLFWMEVDDHDFDEVRYFYLLSPKGELKKFEYSDEQADLAIPVKNRLISTSLTYLLKDIHDFYGDTEHVTQTIEKLHTIYISGLSFPDVFMRFFRTYFPDQPLLFVNPGDAQLKELAKPIFRRVIMRQEAVKEALLNQAQRLSEKAYEVQAAVSKRGLHMFYVPDRERVRLSLNAVYSSLHLSNDEKEEQINDFIEQNTETLSPDVLLRPVIQDFLFPTVAYIAGPSEIAYLAQLKELYNLLDVEMPVIYPRWSGTVIDEKTISFLSAGNISPRELVADDSNETFQKLIENSAGKDYSSAFHSTSVRLHECLNELRELSRGIDKSLISMIDQSEKKMQYHIDKIHNRFNNSIQSSNKVTVNRARRAHNILRPFNRLQERTYSLVHFFLRYGSDFTDFIVRNITINTEKHNILNYTQE